MPNKYLELQNGRQKEKAASDTSAGAGDAGKVVALDANGKLDNSLLPTGVGAETKQLPASEALSAGDFVSVWDDGGTTKVRKADATAEGKEGDGFVLSSYASGATADVYVSGINDQLSGLTGGAVSYLDTTAGGVTATAPAATGNVVQRIGKALSATELAFEPGDPVTRA